MGHKVTKDNKEMLELRDLRVRQEDQDLQVVLDDLVQREKG